MAQYFINGSKYSFSTVIGDPVPVTSISNAENAVVTASVAPDEDAMVMMTSNWTDLNELTAYVKNVASNTFELARVDTEDETLFPDDESSAGHYQVVSGFTQLSQIRDISQSGGDQNAFTWGYVDDRSLRLRSKPTDQNPIVLTFTMDYDPELPWFSALETLTLKRQLTTMRERLTSGDVLVYTGYLSLNNIPTHVRNENMTVTATMSINSQLLRYPAKFFSGS